MVKEKEKIIKMIQSLPEDSTIDDIIEELHFRMKVDHGIKEIDEGKGIEHNEVKKRFSRWLEK